MYHYVERIWVVLVTPFFFCITYTITKKYYPGELVNRYIQSSINIIQDNNRVITKKKGEGTLPLFCVNIERIIPIVDTGKENKAKREFKNKRSDKEVYL